MVSSPSITFVCLVMVVFYFFAVKMSTALKVIVSETHFIFFTSKKCSKCKKLSLFFLFASFSTFLILIFVLIRRCCLRLKNSRTFVFPNRNLNLIMFKSFQEVNKKKWINLNLQISTVQQPGSRQSRHCSKCLFSCPCFFPHLSFFISRQTTTSALLKNVLINE